MRFEGDVMSLNYACTMSSTSTSTSSSSSLSSNWNDQQIVDPMAQLSMKDNGDQSNSSIWPKRTTGLTRCANSHRQADTSTVPCNLQSEEHCIVEAKQIEIDLASLTARPFIVRIEAPNGETSRNINLPTYGSTEFFCPKQEGCGHGDWKFEVFESKDNRLNLLSTETIYLDGVGSLLFTVDDEMHLRLSSQQFLRLPSAARCCKRCQDKKQSSSS